jgi:hypothetical protein
LPDNELVSDANIATHNEGAAPRPAQLTANPGIITTNRLAFEKFTSTAIAGLHCVARAFIDL